LPDIVVMTVFGTKLLTVVTMDSVKHSHIPLTFGALDKLFISPFMHQAHHGSAEVHWDKNFGTNLSIFDWMFGTAYRPEKGEQIAYGIHGYTAEALQEFNTFKGSFIAPLKRSAEALARPFTSVQMAS
jgi:sterol desaturase/sphingolipid hydroxylase (fatty acid hydroxylase superfamily)